MTNFSNTFGITMRNFQRFPEQPNALELIEFGVKAEEFPNINTKLLFKAMGGLFMGIALMGDRKKPVSEKDIEELISQLIINPEQHQ